MPQHLEDRQIRRVAKWARCTWLEAFEMRRELPHLFARILGWCDVESEAMPITMDVAKAKAERESKHEQATGEALRRARTGEVKTGSDRDLLGQLNAE